MAKDKFKKMQQGGGFSFEDMVKQATTVANIEEQIEPAAPQPSVANEVDSPSPTPVQTPAQEQRFMRLPNPQMPIAECNLVARYCEQFPNMTRQDFVELAIIEKLHNDCGMSQEDFNQRYNEIRNRPIRGQRRNTKTLPEKSK